MSRARVLVAGLLQLLVGASVVQGAMILFRFVVHPAVISTLALDATTASATRRLGVFAVAVASYWAFVHWYERRAVRELQIDWRRILAGAVAGSLSVAGRIALLYATGHYQLTDDPGLYRPDRADVVWRLPGDAQCLGGVGAPLLLERHDLPDRAAALRPG